MTRRDQVLRYWTRKQQLLANSRWSYDSFGYTTEQLQDPRLFNEIIGNPIQSSTDLPHALMPYQLDLISCEQKDLFVSKANKCGITETINRDTIQRGTVGDCAGFKILFGSSQKGLAKENLKRVRRKFQGSDFLRQFVQKDLENTLELKNGTEYLVMPAEASAVRSYERVKYVWWDEAAHIDLLDDREIFAAASARRANTNGYVRAVSTPRGMRGFFWDLYTRAVRGEIRAAHRELPYTLGLGVFFEEEFIEAEKLRLGPLFSQEYECAFLPSYGSAAIETELIESSRTGEYSLDPW